MKDGLWKFAEYCTIQKLPERRLSSFERLTLTGGEELERALNWISAKFAHFNYRDRIGDIDVAAIQSAAEFYSQPLWIGRPEAFFRPPEDPPEICRTLLHGLGDGEILDLEFDSTYRVQHPKYAAQYEGATENRKVHARYWRHSTPASATMIAVHGWTMGDQRINSLAFLPGVFYRMGLDVVLFELPFHGRRRPENAPSDGEFFPSADMIRTNEAMGQAISDLRALAKALKSQGAANIGCIGMSLGAYVGSLWSGLDPLQFSIQFVPMVSMDEAAWRILSQRSDFERLVAEGLTVDLLKSVYRIHSPLTYQPQLSSDRALIIAGIGDQIVPSRQPKLLWEHWGRPRFQLFTGGHVTQFRRSQSFEEVQSFLLELGFAQRAVAVR